MVSQSMLTFQNIFSGRNAHRILTSPIQADVRQGKVYRYISELVKRF